MKTAASRVTETRDYIEAYATSGLPQNIRHDIATLIDTRLPRTNRLQKQQFDQLSGRLSVKDNLVHGVRGTEDEREQRRAIVLLWSVLAATQPDPAKFTARLQRGMALAPGALAAELTFVMRRAAVVASNAGAAHIFLTDFVANPGTFIQNERIFVGGSPAGSAKIAGPVPVPPDYRNVLAFYFCYNAGGDRFEFSRGTPPIHGGSYMVWSVSVPAIHWSDVENRGIVPTPTLLAPAGFQDLRGIELAGATFMVTTQFTGCSFCYAENGATVYAAHVSPAGIVGKPALTGQVLANQIMGSHALTGIAGGVMSNWPGGALAAPPLNVFGNGVGNAAVLGGNAFYPPKVPGGGGGQMAWMTIFGLKTLGGAWELYTQSVDGVDAIMEHRRIL